MDNSVLIAGRGGRGIRRISGNGQQIKNKFNK